MFGRDIGIDLGTASVLIYVKGRGIVLREPSVVALDRATGNLLEVGSEAQRMLGRTPGTIAAVRPLRDGVISDYEMTERMLKVFLSACREQSCSGRTWSSAYPPVSPRWRSARWWMPACMPAPGVCI